MSLKTYLLIILNLALLGLIVPAMISTNDTVICGAGIFAFLGWCFFAINACLKGFHRLMGDVIEDGCARAPKPEVNVNCQCNKPSEQGKTKGKKK